MSAVAWVAVDASRANADELNERSLRIRLHNLIEQRCTHARLRDSVEPMAKFAYRWLAHGTEKTCAKTLDRLMVKRAGRRRLGPVRRRQQYVRWFVLWGLAEAGYGWARLLVPGVKLRAENAKLCAFKKPKAPINLHLLADLTQVAPRVVIKRRRSAAAAAPLADPAGLTPDVLDALHDTLVADPPLVAPPSLAPSCQAGVLDFPKENLNTTQTIASQPQMDPEGGSDDDPAEVRKQLLASLGLPSDYRPRRRSDLPLEPDEAPFDTQNLGPHGLCVFTQHRNAVRPNDRLKRYERVLLDGKWVELDCRYLRDRSVSRTQLLQAVGTLAGATGPPTRKTPAARLVDAALRVRQRQLVRSF